MTISEVSKKYGLSADTLRYYEKAGLIPTVHRTESGLRNYTPQDCSWVEFIKCMRAAGLSIEVLQQYVALSAKGNHTLKQRKFLLIKERARIEEEIKTMQETLNRLDEQLALFEEKISAEEPPVNA